MRRNESTSETRSGPPQKWLRPRDHCKIDADGKQGTASLNGSGIKGSVWSGVSVPVTASA